MFDAILARRRSSMLEDIAMLTVVSGALLIHVAGVGWVIWDASRFHAAASAPPKEPSSRAIAMASAQLGLAPRPCTTAKPAIP